MTRQIPLRALMALVLCVAAATASAQTAGRWQYFSADYKVRVGKGELQPDRDLFRLDTATGKLEVCTFEFYADKALTPPVGYRMACLPVLEARAESP